ncbi:transposase [Gordonia shandongensis]|uniref:transposase n=1 Tax=Gordonia shandongensis TaxID=376351 RepID=UPI00040A8B8F|nr:transposase [Gordonia shandongensis]
MKNSTVFYPQIQATADGVGIITHGGSVLATGTAEISGLTDALRTALAPWRKPLATHDPAKILLDLTTSLIVSGDCLADISMMNRPGFRSVLQARMDHHEQEVFAGDA